MRWLVGFAAVAIMSGGALADQYPSRPVTIVVPFPAGGTTDTAARILIEGMRPSLGQPLIIENIGGGGGTLGVTRAVNAKPDGYTLSMGQWGSHVGNGATFNLPYDLLTALDPISLLVSTPLWMVTRKTLPADDLKSFIAWLKLNPSKATAGTIGVGSPGHLCAIHFQNVTDTRVVVVPYRGGNVAMSDLISGNIDFQCSIASNSRPHVMNGYLKPLAMMSKARWFAAPDVPTADEMGVPGLHLSIWHGLWAPSGPPKEVIKKLNSAVVAALTNPAVQQRFRDQGDDIFPREQMSPESLYAHQKAEIDKWWPIIKQANIQIEAK
jgi:tripartite-type tricarboxylate transporter receptor subunit TctC